MRNRQGAFTLVEVLVATFIIGVAVTSMLSALTGLDRAELRVQDRDWIDRLAHEKLDELVATQTFLTESGGEFTDPEDAGASWAVEDEPTGIDGLSSVRVTVTGPRNLVSIAETLVYTSPETQEPTGQ